MRFLALPQMPHFVALDIVGAWCGIPKEFSGFEKPDYLDDFQGLSAGALLCYRRLLNTFGRKTECQTHLQKTLR